MTVEIAPVIRRITALIVRAVDPDEVILFGSTAKGTAGPDSDLDLMVIGPFRGPRHRRGRELRGLLDRFPVQIDLHLMTREELAAESATPFSWVETLRATAITLYVRSPKKGKDPNIG
jgi:predicted nucleotidyltransferase